LSEAIVAPLIQHWMFGILPEVILPSSLINEQGVNSEIPLYLASVVPHQTRLWQTYPYTNQIDLDDIPLSGVYHGLGCDRALALLGAGETYGYPILVIDGGTALTFTGADANKCLIGGAILPGLGLQLESLGRGTAALPTVQVSGKLPLRWARETDTAIESGVVHTIIAGIRDFIADWQCQFPDSQVLLTGGDGGLLLSYLETEYPHLRGKLITDSRLIFWGMRSVVFSH
jgi:type III pantothenate kinase